MANVPHEIVTEILTRLPAKSLLKFRCVCKTWCSLTYDPTFTKLHLARSIERDDVNLLATTVVCKTQVYCVDGFDKTFKVKVPFGESPFEASKSKVIGSCNGIVCLVDGRHVCLLNPYTREYKFVKLNKFSVSGVAIFGFGYIGEDYKLVRFVNSPEYSSEVAVYSLNHASCTTVISNIPYQLLRRKESWVFLNGALHWLGYEKDNFSKTIVSLNVGDKVFRDFSKPNVGMDETAFMTVGVWGGELCLLCSHRFDFDIEIWVMKNYGQSDSWIKLFAFPKIIMMSVNDSWPNQPNPRLLCFGKYGEVLLRDGRNIVIYNPKDKTTRNLEIQFISESDCSEMDIVIHLASLIPLCSGTHVETVTVDVKKKSKLTESGKKSLRSVA